jgi:hypothetical protein
MAAAAVAAAPDVKIEKFRDAVAKLDEIRCPPDPPLPSLARI